MKKKMIAPIVVAVLLVAYFVVYGLALYTMPDAPIVFKMISSSEKTPKFANSCVHSTSEENAKAEKTDLFLSQKKDA